MPIVASGTYLRYRAAAERAYRARRRAMWWRRLATLVAGTLLYFAIGRDLIGVGVAKKDEVAMEVRHDVHTLGKDLERIVGSSKTQPASHHISPLAFTSAAALARTGNPSDIDAWLSDEPVEVYSRAQQTGSP